MLCKGYTLTRSLTRTRTLTLILTLTLTLTLTPTRFAALHTDEDLVPPPPCPFNFELGELNLDHYLLAGLDAVRAFHPDYPLKVVHT